MSAAEHAVDCKLEINAPDLASLETLGGRNFSGRPTLDATTVSEIQATLDPVAQGKKLFKALLPAESELLRGYREALAVAKREKKVLRLRLQVAATAPLSLHALRWELLLDPKASIGWSSSLEVAFSRCPAVPEPEGEPVEETPRLLVAIAEPSDLAAYQLPASRREEAEAAVEEALAPLRAKIRWEVLAAPLTAERLFDRLHNGRFHALHLQAHGLVRGERATLVLEKEDGTADFVDEEDFAEIFKGLSGLRLVTLVACHGGVAPGGSPLSGLGPGLIERGIPAVLAMRQAISFDAARMFSEYFYRQLAEDGVVDRAANVARHQLRLARRKDEEWSTPILFMRLAEGRLWASRSPMTAEMQESLLKLLEKVERLAEDSLRVRTASRSLNLAVEWSDRLRSPLASEGREEVASLPSEGLPALLRDRQRLLILGGPGSGKTVTLLRLALDLIHGADRSAPLPRIPVLLSLASWKHSDTDLAEWLVRELNDQAPYVPPREGRQYVNAGQLLPMLDGLDEVHPKDRGACVAAIRRYLKQRGGPLVVTCRTQSHQDLPAPFHLEAEIVLQPVDAVSVDAYLAQGGKKLGALRAVVRDHETLRDLARTPLWLNLMCDAYKEAPVEALQALAASSPTEQPRWVVEAYVDRMEQRPGSMRYKTVPTRRRLTWLARQMRAHRMKRFEIELLQPVWLPTLAERWLYAVLTRAIAGGLLAAPLALFEDYFLPGGLVAGALAGLVDALPMWHSPKGSGAKALAVQRTIRVLAIASVGFATFSRFSPSGNSQLPLSSLLGLIFGLVFGARPIDLGEHTKVFERLSWKWSLKGGRNGAVVGSLWSVSLAILDYIRHDPHLAPFPVVVWIALTAVSAVVGFAFGGVVGGLKGSTAQRRRTPNVGLRRGLRKLAKGVLLTSVFTVPVGTAVGFLPRLDWMIGAATGLVIALYVGLWFGGLDLLQHWTTRTLLSATGRFPWRWVRFLNHASDRGLLYRIERGYEFPHDFVRDYYCDLREEKDEAE